jgi:hypothetical protein
MPLTWKRHWTYAYATWVDDVYDMSCHPAQSWKALGYIHMGILLFPSVRKQVKHLSSPTEELSSVPWTFGGFHCCAGGSVGFGGLCNGLMATLWHTICGIAREKIVPESVRAWLASSSRNGCLKRKVDYATPLQFCDATVQHSISLLGFSIVLHTSRVRAASAGLVLLSPYQLSARWVSVSWDESMAYTD